MENNSNFPVVFTDSQTQTDHHWIYYIELSVGLLSIVGSFFIVFVFLFYKKLRCFAFELIVYLSIASMIDTLSYLIHYVDQENIIIADMTLCRIQAFIMIWFDLSQMIWITLIGYSVYENVIHYENIDFNQRTPTGKRIVYLILGFGLPVIFPIIGILFNFLGPSGRWCWINPTTDIIWAQLYGGTVYILVWVLIIVNLVLTIIVVRYLDKISVNKEEKEIISKFIWKLIRYPLIQIICILPITINRLIFALTGKFFQILEVIAIVVIFSQGLAYALSYGFNPQVRVALKETFYKICKCCKRPPSEITSLTDSFATIYSYESKSSEAANLYRTSFLNN